MARTLAPAEAASALRRGVEIEQLASVEDGVVHYVTASGRHGQFVVVEDRVQDAGSANFLDLGSFPPVDQDEESGDGRQLATVATAEEAVAVVTGHGGGVDRWLNQGVAADHYWSGKSNSR